MSDGKHPKFEELERLLNDPDVPMRPGRVWELVADVAAQADSTGTDQDIE